MKVIEQKESIYNIDADLDDGKLYLYQDDTCFIEQECIEVDKQGAKQLIEILKEFVNE